MHLVFRYFYQEDEAVLLRGMGLCLEKLYLHLWKVFFGTRSGVVLPDECWTRKIILGLFLEKLLQGPVAL